MSVLSCAMGAGTLLRCLFHALQHGSFKDFLLLGAVL